jgi:hypothetical protein
VLEFIQVILGVLGKALPAAMSQHRKKRLNELGAELFMFYIQVNEILVCAETILTELEEFVDRMTRHADVGDNYALRTGNRISGAVQLQYENLRRIVLTMNRLSSQLQVVDGQAYAKVSVLLHFKAQVVNALFNAMRSGSLPISAGLATDLQALMDVASENDRFNFLHLGHEIGSKITRESVALNMGWDIDIYRHVAGYLEEQQPRQQISQIRAALEDIRSALEKNFSIQDILLVLDSTRFRHGESS